MTDGYDPGFLALPLPLPKPVGERTLLPLPSTHFEVHLDTDRKLAAFTAVNLDGEQLVDVERADDWHLDPRAPAATQTGPEVYANNDLDRGHLVRRRDPVWGSRATAERANRETFSYANAAPQAAVFNQGPLLWAGVEDYVLSAARVARARLSVFTGPVFSTDDALYRGTRIPRRFWKVAAWRHLRDNETAELRAVGYLLDQSALVTQYDDTRRTAIDEPELGEFRTFQVPIRDIAAATNLQLDPLVDADRLVAVSGALGGAGWRELEQLEDSTL